MSLAQDPKIINVDILDEHTLNVELNNNTNIKLDMRELMKYPGYSKLRDRAFFNKVTHEEDIIFWDDMHDMHIHQILEYGKTIPNCMR